MSSQQQSYVLAHAKSRRAANNNYQKLSKTLYEKLAKLCLEYDTHVYFLAYRNGRMNGFVSTDETGQSWSPPSQETLVSPSPFTTYQELTPVKDKLYPPPVIKSPAHYHRARRGRGRVTFRKAISQEGSAECSATSTQE
jgi:hypothetical protein